MARPETELDPDADPVQAFAFELRRLREKAGKPAYRELAKQAHYSAAALARAADGHKLPTLELTLAYVAACGGDMEEWKQRWHDLGTSGNAPPIAAPRPVPAENPAPQEFASEVMAAVETPRPRAGLRSRRRWTVVIMGAVLLLVVGTVLALIFSTAGPPPMIWTNASHVLPLSVGPGQTAIDGADPMRAECTDAATIASEQVWIGSVKYGLLELRHSRICGSAWSRFNPHGSLINHPSQDILIRLETIRSADSTVSRVEEAFVRDHHWAGMLRTDKGCVRARGQITIDSNTSEILQTICATG
ncbi:DUF2690 domain-containing protein [Nonomuraea sp. NN258]|uniref:DUF2690 domain-containing protein n=1 Tax=Nonomuraea antri TaxID=2730852 RepID=UPI001567D332|nr:DUF2690 domain-containing protein [Nonomuraea antri]NRQ35428.1 DUF2690 domain-containing protein [Nonomuraea antri]